MADGRPHYREKLNLRLLPARSALLAGKGNDGPISQGVLRGSRACNIHRPVIHATTARNEGDASICRVPPRRPRIKEAAS